MTIWLALVLLSCSWSFALDVSVDADPVRRGALVAAAVAALAWGLARRAGSVAVPRWFGLCLVPLVGAAALAPAPFRTPLLLTSAGVLLLAFARRRPDGVTALLGAAATMAGTVLLAQAPLPELVATLQARAPDVPWLAAPLHAVLAWAGFDASLGEGVVHVSMMRQTHAFPLTLSHLALLPLAGILVAGLLSLWWTSDGRPLAGRALRLALVLVAWAVLRFAAVAAVFVGAMLFVAFEEEVVHVELFWLPAVTLVTMLPLVPLLARALPWPEEGWRASLAPLARGEGRARRVAFAAAVLAALGAVLATSFHDPGVAKAGRVLIDEAHSDWERTDTAFDRDWYGSESVYNYNAMARFAAHYFDVQTNLDAPLSSDRLADVDVLVLKSTTEPYAPAEIDAIEDFVRAGGGLMVFGEHTDVFGTSTHLNPVLRRFGLALRYDAVFDLARKWEQVWFRPELGAHPILADVPFLRFAVSCSIASSSLGVDSVIRGDGLWTLPNDYSVANFYPQVVDASGARFGAFDQMVATSADEGRVVVFGDSTIYSNFQAFMPGQPELLLRSLGWLNRENAWDRVEDFGAALAALAAFVALACAWQTRARALPTAATASVLAASCWLGLAASTELASAQDLVPAPHSPVDRVVFDMEHSGCELPMFGFTQDVMRSYDIFYQWVARADAFPAVAFDVSEAFAGDDPVLVVLPDRPFTSEDVDAARAFVERGGTLCVLDAASTASTSTAAELLAPFELSFDGPAIGGDLRAKGVEGTLCTAGDLAVVRGAGAEVLLETEAGEPVVVERRVGAGRVIVAGLADRFTDPRMGFSSYSAPDGALRAVYELEYRWIDGLRRGDLGGRLRSLGELHGAP